ncbi:MAG TPA: hypothetical protein VNA16_02755 [Abditibacteriaceae bacterium]|nr:hypothetical protein [Abditibacteriaceae bacterium]
MTKVWSYHVAAIALVVLVSLAATGARAAPDEQARAKNADMLIKTLSEEKTEVQQLAAQQATLRKRGGRENKRIADLLGRMIRDHKAAEPGVVKLIRSNGGDPADAKIIKAPVLGTLKQMLHADMVDHMKAETSSQMRYAATHSSAIKAAMSKRAGIARKHMRWMKPYHNERNCAECAAMMHKMHGGMKSGNMKGGQKVAAMCPHCNVKMVNGKCPMCGMTMGQMEASG